MKKKPPQTDAGRAFTKETRGVARTLAGSDRKAAATRRANRRAEDKGTFDSTVFIEAFDGVGRLEWCSSEGIGPDGEGPAVDRAVAGVIGMMQGDPSDPDNSLETDAVLYLAGRIVAVVKYHPTGPAVTRF